MKYLFKTNEDKVIIGYQTCDWLDEAVECDDIEQVTLHKTKLKSVENGKAVLDNSGDYTESHKRAMKNGRIMELKKLLSDTDYMCLKHMDGALTDAEYAKTKAQRQAWRDEINQLEGE
jgi:hypothetical protein